MERNSHDKIAYTLAEAADLLSISVSQLYRLLEQGELSSIRIGGCRRITRSELHEYLKRLEARYRP